MAIKAFSGSISSLPLPDIRLDNTIGEGDILVYDDSKKMFVNSVAADKTTGKLYVTGVTSNVKGQTIINGDGTSGNDITLRSLKSGNLIDIQPSNDGDSLVISVNASIASKLGGPDGFTGELKSSQIVLAGPGPTHEYQFRKIHNNEFIELNANYTIVYRNGRRMNPAEYSFTTNNSIIFYEVTEEDELHIDTITNETDVKLVHSKRVTGVASQTAYEFLDQQNNLLPILEYFLEVFVNRIKVHQQEYIVEENKVIFQTGYILEDDIIEIITLGDI